MLNYHGAQPTHKRQTLRKFFRQTARQLLRPQPLLQLTRTQQAVLNLRFGSFKLNPQVALLKITEHKNFRYKWNYLNVTYCTGSNPEWRRTRRYVVCCVAVKSVIWFGDCRTMTKETGFFPLK